jgi:hypothetical protein
MGSNLVDPVLGWLAIFMASREFTIAKATLALGEFFRLPFRNTLSYPSAV